MKNGFSAGERTDVTARFTVLRPVEYTEEMTFYSDYLNQALRSQESNGLAVTVNFINKEIGRAQGLYKHLEKDRIRLSGLGVIW